MSCAFCVLFIASAVFDEESSATGGGEQGRSQIAAEAAGWSKLSDRADLACLLLIHLTRLEACRGMNLL